MLQRIIKCFTNYVHEIEKIDLLGFNKFIFYKLVIRATKVEHLLPIMGALGVLLFSFFIQESLFVFIPQSSLGSFASYQLLNFLISLVLITIYPLLIIFMVNYLLDKISCVLKKPYFILKLSILILGFYSCLTFLSAKFLHNQERIYLTILWLFLYFMLANLYLAYTHERVWASLSKTKIIVGLLFGILMVKPFLFIYLHTSELINFTTINPHMYLSNTNCSLISTALADAGESANMTVNDPDLFKKADGGCYLSGNSIRYGFGSDYSLMFRKNIKPLTAANGHQYNEYVRLTCYDISNCFTEDGIKVRRDHDLYGDLIKHQNKFDSPL